MKKLAIILGIVTLCPLLSFSQRGDYFISHFTPNTDKSSNFDLVQRPDGLITIANRSGLLLFDGSQWELKSSLGTPMTLALGEDGIFAGGGFGVGYQGYGKNETFEKIHADNIAANVFQIEVVGDKLIAIEDKVAHIFSASQKRHIKTVKLEQGYLRKILFLDNKILVNTTSGNYWLSDKGFEYADEVPEGIIVFIIAVHGGHLAGTEDGKLFDINGGTWVQVNLDNNDFSESLEGARFMDATIAGNKAAITTLNSGVIVFDPVSKKVEKVVNHLTGLPDDELFFIAPDNEGAFWVAHENGLSRIAPYLPLEAFNNFPGLEGHLTCVTEFEGFLYVGTNSGLFRLEEVKDYEEIIQYVRKSNTIQKTEQESKPRNILSFLKRKREGNKTETEKRPQAAESVEKKIFRELKSVQYIYKKVPGIDGKVLQLIPSEQGLIVPTLRALHILNDMTLNTLSREPQRMAWINRAGDFLISNTYDGRLLSFRFNKMNWQETSYFEGFQDFLLDIYEDEKSRIWFSSPNELYFITYDKNNIFHGEDFSYENPFLNNTYITQNKEGEVTFYNENATWTYSEDKQAIEKQTSSENLQGFIKNGIEELWVKENDHWRALNKGVGSSWLKAFEDISYLSTGYDEKLYVITASNNLYKIPVSDNYTGGSQNQQILLKSITGGGEEIVPQQYYKFTQKQSDLTFEFTYPEYTGLMNVEYKYRIVGLNNEWTDWSPGHNKVRLNYPPEGKYQLELKTRTMLGEEISTAPVFFKVVPPYWKTPWFYAFEFTLMAILLMITIYVNRNSQRYRFINKLLAFLTLIIIIEFIQATAESNFETDMSPIAGFFIQVSIAFIVLPIEGFLRRLIIQNKKLKLPLFLRIYPK